GPGLSRGLSFALGASPGTAWKQRSLAQRSIHQGCSTLFRSGTRFHRTLLFASDLVLVEQQRWLSSGALRRRNRLFPAAHSRHSPHLLHLRTLDTLPLADGCGWGLPTISMGRIASGNRALGRPFCAA